MRAKDFEAAKHEAQATANRHQEPVHVWERKDGLFVHPESWGKFGGERGERVHSAFPEYRSIEDIKRRNERNGGKWFDLSNMRFFGTRLQSAIHVHKDGRAFFVTSERDRYQGGPGGGAWGGRRLYSVRVAMQDGSVDTVGEFGAYVTGRAAHKAAARLAAS